MVKIVFIQPDGVRTEVAAAPGVSGMQAARLNGVDGILADCGGSAACGTCHVYVAEEYLPKLAQMTLQEYQMLECTSSERRSNSRLSCQIILTDDLNGLTLHIPDTQA